MKKKHHNGRRRAPAPTPPPVVPAAAPQPLPPPAAPPGATAFDPVMVEHLRVTTSMIEGRKVTRQEIIEMLTRMMSQQGMAPDAPPGYGDGGNHPAPP